MIIKRMMGLMLSLGLITGVMSVARGEVPDTQQEAIGVTPPRLSLTTGEVSFWRPGAEDWVQAQVNTPLAPGDELYSGAKGDMELQIGSRAFVRSGANTQVGLESHEPDFLQFKVTTGSASFDLRTVEPGRTVEVDTPNAAITIEHAGYYRVDVDNDRTSFITRRSGQATLTTPDGQSVSVAPSENVVIQGAENPQVASYAAPPLDEWDKWNYARTDHLLDAVSARYVSQGVYGAADLDRYGSWRSVSDYGEVWVPRGVPARWAPYTAGRWVSDPYYGWTWVDTEPWGWAPYHYGRWVYVNGFWAWAPGPVMSRPAYAPALVAFYQGGAGLSIGVGVGPLVGWVALGWGEPCVPWWGPDRFRHRAWWGGWSGPRVVNDVVINRTTIVNVNEIHTYRNARVPNSVVAVSESGFGRGARHVRVPQADERALRPIHAAPQVAATAASFVPRETRGVRPPARVVQRPVVATRASQPVREVPAGSTTARTAAPVRVATPAPRVVSAPQRTEGGTVPHRAPFGQSNVERRTTDRNRPPTPPAVQGQRRPEQAPGGAPSATQQAPSSGRQPQVAAPAQKPQGTAPRPEAERARPPAPPAVQGQRQPEQPPGAAPSATRQGPPPRREPQVASPSPRQQAPAHPPELERSRPPAVQSQKRPEEANGSVNRQAPPPRREPQVASPSPRPQTPARPPEAERARPAPQPRHEPQVAAPAPARPQAPARPAEVARPRQLPGEPANRLAPGRGSAPPPHKQAERKEPPRKQDEKK